MNPRDITEHADTLVVGAALRIDEMGADLEQQRGKITLAGRTMRIGATLLAAFGIGTHLVGLIIGADSPQRRAKRQADVLAEVDRMAAHWPTHH